MTHEPTACFLGDGDLRARDDGPRERGAEEVDVFVDGVALDGGDAGVLHEFLAQVFDVACRGADLQGFGARGGEVFLLADVGHEADDFVIFLKEPGEDAGGVEAAGVGEADFGFGHCCGEVGWCIGKEIQSISRSDVR